MKKVYVVYGVGEHSEKTIRHTFCKMFKSEKKADEYFDKKYIELLEMYTNEEIDYYSINYDHKKVN